MKILFISYFFPPIKTIACLRTYNLCKGLLAAGHDVQVVTVLLDQIRPAALETPSDFDEMRHNRSYSEHRIPSPLPSADTGYLWGIKGDSSSAVIKFLSRIVRRLLQEVAVDQTLLWSLNAYRHLRRLRGIDCVVVSGGPFSTFIPGFLLSRRYKSRLVLDYRDVWNPPAHGARGLISYRFLERRIHRFANLVTSVSPSCLRTILRDSTVLSHEITNAVPEDVGAFRRWRREAVRNEIVYAGAFYPPKRSVEPLLRSLFLLRADGTESEPLRFRYLGPSTVHVLDAAGEQHVSDLTECAGVVSRDDALKAQAIALAVLVVTTVEEQASIADRGIVTGKIFEAIEVARNVLVISPEHSDVRAMTAHIPHVSHFTGSQSQEIATFLRRLRNESSTQSADRPCYFPWTDVSQKFASAIEAIHHETTTE